MSEGVQNRLERKLEQATAAIKSADWALAVRLHIEGQFTFPQHRELFAFGLQLSRSYYLKSREAQKLRIAVACWELSHNPAGRALTLADLYLQLIQQGKLVAHKPAVIGFHFERWGNRLWPPMEGTSYAVKTVTVTEDWHQDDRGACSSNVLPQAIQLVLANPFDVVHLSKPRGPNLILGLLYQWFWNARVIVDVDDEELGFFNKNQPIESLDPGVSSWLKVHQQLPHLAGITRKQWTYFSVANVSSFAAVTVSNPALQARYSGVVIPHARVGSIHSASWTRKAAARKKFGLSADDKIVLFFGTPRPHKGLTETVRAIAELASEQVTYVVVGDFIDEEFKTELTNLAETLGVNMRCFGNQPYDEIADVVALGDVAIILQDIQSSVAQFQVPAKLTDALAQKLVVFANETPALADFFAEKALVSVTKENLSIELAKYLVNADATTRCQRQSERGYQFFQRQLASEVVCDRLLPLVDRPRSKMNEQLTEIWQALNNEYTSELEKAFLADSW